MYYPKYIMLRLLNALILGTELILKHEKNTPNPTLIFL